ncbi:hypothetical protein phytr_11970 [Candidatus Phycorickettsia trachydisci]|uniref:Transposase n=1 Tax=Candidatus Phycorickettsia trachydisci TaxID=2115978 RepID=A0A2P1PA10_9RICK|nr:IS1 family transposase [Candidatus Phycorickettsia trachydisci]AVP88122.1 hypothetical protein phytr_11970 [Candidatus Phycorickettsia trachydisci]
MGYRNVKTYRRLYDKVKHLKSCTFYTDDWIAFKQVLPAKPHMIGKRHTVTIERDNSNTRHHLGSMARKVKVVSKSVDMVDMTLKMRCALTDADIFKIFQTRALSIFK